MRKFFKPYILIGFTVSLSLICISFLAMKRGYNEGDYKESIIPPKKIAVGTVNLSVIRNEALVFTSFKELIAEQYKTFYTELQEEEGALRKSFEEIKKQESTGKKLTPELQKRRSELDQKIVELEKKIREKKDRLNASLANATNEIEQTIHAIIIEVAKKYKLNLVFNATILDAPVVLYGGEELDITPQILEELDRRLPTAHLR